MKRILFSLFCSINIFAMEIDKENLFVPHKLGSLSVIKKDRGFSVLKDGQEHKVASYNTDKMLNKMNSKQLTAFLANNGGHIDVNQLSDDEYTLKAKAHGKGGGPILAAAGYWGVKVLGYGVPATAAVATIVASAPVVAGTAAGGAIATATTTTVAGVSGTIAAGTATLVGTATTGGSIAVGAVSAGIVEAVGVSTVATTAGAVFTAAGSTATGYIAAVEGTASLVAAALLAVPFL